MSADSRYQASHADRPGRAVRRILPADYVAATDRLVLRALRREDAQDLACLAADPRISRWTQVLPDPIERYGALAFIEAARRQASRGLDYAMAVEQRSGGNLIGCVGLHPAASAPLARLGYWLGCRFWSQGFGTEAIGAALGICFGGLRMQRVEADAHEENVASWRALERAGLRFERHTRRALSPEAGMVPVRRYGLDRAQWETADKVRSAGRPA